LTRRSAIILIGLTALSVLIAMQGWRSRLLYSDLWVAAKSAESFLSSGKIPDYGCLSSLRSYIPPGSNLFIIPGVWLFQDQRFFELPAAVLLHLGTLAGLFLLCRLYFNERCAYLSVALYSVSALGLQFAISLWPRGHPFFTVWFFYCIGVWYVRNRPRALGYALFTWAVGMYYFMELAPLLAAIPIVYVVRRPKISKAAAIGALLGAAFVWAPYLSFEHGRNYRDLRSLLSRKVLDEGNRTNAVSPYPILEASTNKPLPQGGPEPRHSLVVKLGYRVAGAVTIVLANFTENTAIPGTAGALLALSVSGLGVRARRFKPVLAAVILILGLACMSIDVLSQAVAHRTLQPATSMYVWSLGLNLVVALLVILAASKLPRVESEALLFACCFAATWGLTALLVDAVGLGRRIWWAWPVQIAFIAYFLSSLSKRTAQILAMVVLVILAANRMAAARWNDAWNHGWNGEDVPALQLLDAAVASGKPLSIGYLVVFPSWFPDFWKTADGYKVGTEFDLYLSRHHGVRNSSQGDYGLGVNDEFILVQTEKSGPPDAVYAYLAGVPMDGYEEVKHAGDYSLWRRKASE
jgi:hypothetical protein